MNPAGCFARCILVTERCAAKERGAEEPCVHGDHPSCPSCSKCMAFHGQEKIRKLENSLHAVSEKLVEVEHEKAQLERPGGWF